MKRMRLSLVLLTVTLSAYFIGIATNAYRGSKLSAFVVENSAKSMNPLSKKMDFWSRTLHFIPEDHCGNCMKLFTTSTSANASMTPEWKKLRRLLRAEATKNGGLPTPEHLKLVLTYQELARQPFVHTVCEIGFNIGQSAVAWLTVKPDLKLFSFDMGARPSVKHMGDFLEARYAGRFKLKMGDSKVTIPEFAKLGISCDIVSIDGDHTYTGAYRDLQNMRRVAANRHLIVADDIYLSGVARAWQDLQAAGFVKHLFECKVPTWPKLDIDFALGYYQTGHNDTV